MTEEFDKYRCAQAQAWLEHIRALGVEVERLQGLVEAERAMLDGVRGIDYTREHVDGTRDLPDVADLVDRLFDHIREYAASLAAYTDERAQAARALERLGDAVERRAVTEHYLMGLTWTAVCERLGYSKQRMMQIRKGALLHCYELMPHEWRDPRHGAI